MLFSLCKLCDPPQRAQVIIHVILTGERQGKQNRVIIIILQTELWETMTCRGPKPVSYEWRLTIRCVVASCFLPNTQPCFSAWSYRWLLFFFYTFNSFVHFFFTLAEPCGMWVPWPGIKPVPPTLEAWTLNSWTTREVSCLLFWLFPRTLHTLEKSKPCPLVVNNGRAFTCFWISSGGWVEWWERDGQESLICHSECHPPPSSVVFD